MHGKPGPSEADGCIREDGMKEIYIAESLTGLIAIIGLFYDITKAN